MTKQNPAPRNFLVKKEEKEIAEYVSSLRSEAGKSLRDVFEDELKDIYWAEQNLANCIAGISQIVSAEDFLQFLTAQLNSIKGQIRRLESVFDSILMQPQVKICPAMERLIRETEKMMIELGRGDEQDLATMLSMQKIARYKIATYGILGSFAKALGERESAYILEEILREERNRDDKLNKLSKNFNHEQSKMTDPYDEYNGE